MKANSSQYHVQDKEIVLHKNTQIEQSKINKDRLIKHQDDDQPSEIILKKNPQLIVRAFYQQKQIQVQNKNNEIKMKAKTNIYAKQKQENSSKIKMKLLSDLFQARVVIKINKSVQKYRNQKQKSNQVNNYLAKQRIKWNIQLYTNLLFGVEQIKAKDKDQLTLDAQISIYMMQFIKIQQFIKGTVKQIDSELLKQCNNGNLHKYGLLYKGQWKIILNQTGIPNNTQLRKNIIIKKYTANFLATVADTNIYLLFSDSQRIENQKKVKDIIKESFVEQNQINLMKQDHQIQVKTKIKNEAIIDLTIQSSYNQFNQLKVIKNQISSTNSISNQLQDNLYNISKSISQIQKQGCPQNQMISKAVENNKNVNSIRPITDLIKIEADNQDECLLEDTLEILSHKIDHEQYNQPSIEKDGKQFND